jgi:hypothetical protein
MLTRSRAPRLEIGALSDLACPKPAHHEEKNKKCKDKLEIQRKTVFSVWDNPKQFVAMLPEEWQEISRKTKNLSKAKMNHFLEALQFFLKSFPHKNYKKTIKLRNSWFSLCQCLVDFPNFFAKGWPRTKSEKKQFKKNFCPRHVGKTMPSLQPDTEGHLACPKPAHPQSKKKMTEKRGEPPKMWKFSAAIKNLNTKKTAKLPENPKKKSRRTHKKKKTC